MSDSNEDTEHESYLRHRMDVNYVKRHVYDALYGMEIVDQIVVVSEIMRELSWINKVDVEREDSKDACDPNNLLHKIYTANHPEHICKDQKEV